MAASPIGRSRRASAAAFACGLGAAAYLYLAPLITTGGSADSGAIRVGALTARDPFTLFYGGLGVLLALVGLLGSLTPNRAGRVLHWFGGVGLAALSMLAFVATFGEPRISFVFLPAGALMLWSCNERSSPNPGLATAPH